MSHFCAQELGEVNLDELGEMSFGTLKLGVMSFGSLKLGKVNFGMLKLGEVSFGPLNLSELGEVSFVILVFNLVEKNPQGHWK